jgi:ankyrin repeat protein
MANTAPPSEEEAFRSFANCRLKPLLEYISTECLARIAPGVAGVHIVDFVLQLLTSNKAHLHRICQDSSSNVSASARVNRDPTELCEASLDETNPIPLTNPSFSSAQVDPQISDRLFALCSNGIANGFSRRDPAFLRKVFDKHSDSSGHLAVAKIPKALADAFAPVIPQTESDAIDLVSRYDVNASGGMDFAEFERAAATPDELQIWFQDKHQPMLADAFREIVGRGEDQLRRLVDLTDSDVRSVSAAACAALRIHAVALHQELRHSLSLATEMQAQIEAESSKFSVYTMSCGGIGDFHVGLTGRVGMPSLQFKDAMMREHCERAGCDLSFTTSNYKITTTPAQEWRYVAGDANGHPVPCPSSDMAHGRRIVLVEELLRRPISVRAKLIEAEMIAIVLYTGPMFQIYNTILRRFPVEVYTPFEVGGNLFAATIFVLVSAISKLSRCTRIPEGTILYRGLGGLMDLPESFLKEDENGCSGYADWGFMSTTCDRDVALGYSGLRQRRPKAMVMALEATSVDRGADVSEFSQYPGEKEFLWVPCSFVQRAKQAKMRVQLLDGGLVTFLPVRVNLNLKTETVEELQEKKKKLHLVSARSMVEEVRHALGEWAATAYAVERLKRDPRTYGFYSLSTLSVAIVKQFEVVVKRHEDTPIHIYSNDAAFRMLVSEILDNKSWAMEKKQLWMQDESQLICFLQDYSLRECHRLWQTYLKQRIAASIDPVDASLNLLVSKGLIKQGVRGELNSDGEELLIQAGADGWHAGDVTAAVTSGADLDAIDGNGCGSVCNAARYGNMETMESLILGKCDVNTCNPKMQSAIWIASRNGQMQCLARLIAHGGDIHQCDSDDRSPICIASERGHDTCLQLLIAARGDVNKRTKHDASPVDMAAQNGHETCLVLLIGAGGNVNPITKDGWSPIYLAASNGKVGCLMQLIAAGGDINKCTCDGVSPIFAASSSGHDDCLALLIQHKGDVNAADVEGKSLIHIAAQNGHDACLALLIDGKGDVNACDNAGLSPIYVAAQNGHVACLSRLISAGGDVAKCDNDGVLPSLAASRSGHDGCLALLAAAAH